MRTPSVDEVKRKVTKLREAAEVAKTREPLTRRRIQAREPLSAQEHRWIQLKRELSRGFGRGTDLLLDADWLHDNDVTLTECGRLSDWIANCLAASSDLDAMLRDFR